MQDLNGPKRLWRRYVIALTIVLASLGISHFASKISLRGSDEATSVINIAGRQHMLSQKILYLAARARSGEMDPRLAEAIDEFETSHLALVWGGSLGLSTEGAAERAPAYFTAIDGLTLDSMTRLFIEDARRVSADMPNAEDAWWRMEMIGPALLLKRLSGAVAMFEEAVQQRTNRVETIADATFVVAILVVVAEALFIFLPAQRSVNRAIDEMEASNARLDAARTRADTLRQAAEADRAVAERAREVQSQFLSYISHELRTPLNGVVGMLTLMGDEPSREDMREHVKVARSASDQLLSIVCDVLDLSKLEAGQMRVADTPFDMRLSAQASVSILRSRAQQKGVALEAEIDADMPALISGDAGRIQQVLTNLLSNAVTYTDEGAVTLHVAYDRERDGGTVCVRVVDTGTGIAPEEQKALFEPFRQTERLDARQQAGTGLGLSICKQLVALMGGRIGLESTPGEGSCFWFDIPCAAVEAPPAPAPERAICGPRAYPTVVAETSCNRPAKGSGMTILVVDDNAVNRLVASRYVTRAGHSTLSAENGSEAVEMVRGGGIDLVLMDINMPVLDGFGATRQIRALDGPMADIPIIALTADATAEDRNRVLASGLDGYLCKPIRREDLLEIIANVSGADGSAVAASPAA